MPTKLRRLKKEALEPCIWRGHKMSRFKHVVLAFRDSPIHRATCLRCAMFVDVNVKPAPNEIDIGGEAVALRCPLYCKD